MCSLRQSYFYFYILIPYNSKIMDRIYIKRNIVENLLKKALCFTYAFNFVKRLNTCDCSRWFVVWMDTGPLYGIFVFVWSIFRLFLFWTQTHSQFEYASFGVFRADARWIDIHHGSNDENNKGFFSFFPQRLRLRHQWISILYTVMSIGIHIIIYIHL